MISECRYDMRLVYAQNYSNTTCKYGTQTHQFEPVWRTQIIDKYQPEHLLLVGRS